MYECTCKFLFLWLSLQKPPEDATPQKKKTGSAKRREKKLKNEPSSVTAETLPGGLQVVEFAEARATELQCLLKAVTGKEMGKRTFQKLPRHMRRRAMSHNIRRLPRRLREKAAKEVCGCGWVCVGHTPCYNAHTCSCTNLDHITD